MAKSAENFLTLENTFVKQGIQPLVYRFAAFQTHYRKPMEYSPEAVQAAQNGFHHLQNQIREIAEAPKTSPRSVGTGFKEKFTKAVNADLNMPRAMAVVQELLKSPCPDSEKLTAIIDFDRILGLDLDKVDKTDTLPLEIQQMVEDRKNARVEKNWEMSDRLRDDIQARGYVVQDTKDGMKVFKP